jgi:AraC-like DNA-binding protein
MTLHRTIQPRVPGRMFNVYRSCGRDGFREFAELVGDVCDVAIPEGKDTFQAQSRVVNLGAALLTEMRSSSLHYERTTRHVARSAFDHFQLHLNLVGNCHVRSGRQTAVFRPGDIGVMDTARSSQHAMLAPHGLHARSVSIFLPRSLLAPLLPSPGHGHCTVLSGDSVVGRLLGDHLVSLLHRTEPASSMDHAVALQGIVGLLARGLGSTERIQPMRSAMREAALTSLQRYVEEHLDSSGLSADTICKHSGWSRATVYRLFESEGGLVAYVQQQRLQRALMELIFGRSRRRVLDIALQSQFSSEATFNRAFRRTFGIPPGEARTLARHSMIEPLPGNPAAAANDPETPVRWIRQLGRNFDAGQPVKLGA